MPNKMAKKLLEETKKQVHSNGSQKEQKKMNGDIPPLKKLIASDGWFIRDSVKLHVQRFSIEIGTICSSASEHQRC